MPRKRKNQVKIYLSDEEIAKFNKKVEQSKMNKTEYFIRCTNRKKIIVVEGLKETLIELKRIGANINQISKNLNSGVFQNVSDDVKVIKGKSSKILDSIIDVLRKVK